MFEIEPHSQLDKSFKVYNSDLGIEFLFDYDDVDHAMVEVASKRICDILNENLPRLYDALDVFAGSRQWMDK